MELVGNILGIFGRDFGEAFGGSLGEIGSGIGGKAQERNKKH